ncbi:putative mediator of RNA polymerase II transcription subunit 26 isoform X2 [Drosophila innubila]|uniref:putative mediator of RNA polymerase II transcription subunit 26 isoform X2 n=1 Tax=Drosophila innubila TaxID=198719 RepID=UPI00148B6EAC|nr:putative mediator of RNA polymerase II transcription subunit 26 isoform X2 [Drosophila innubila]
MDFLSNLIKRPNSIAMSVPEESSSSIEPSTETSSPQISLIMDRCSIDTELENLFESAAKDLNCLEEQHNHLIDIDTVEKEEVKPTLATPTKPSPKETIQQLLSEINVNLDRVTAHEMEHLQAMSLELSPLAVKASPRHSVEQQKALVAAMRSTSQPGTPTMPPVNYDPFKQLELEPGIPKFTGLPEFDETQIPELAPLSVEMEAQLKAEEPVMTVKPIERDYNSDSDVYAECLSLNSVKMSAEQSELEAYSSALNEVLEHQLSNVTATTLDNTLSEPDTAAQSHNDSCEPMDVDEICETMEILKDVLAPEDHQMLQQQFLAVAMQEEHEQEIKKKDKELPQQQKVKVELLEQHINKEQQEQDKEPQQTLEQLMVKEQQVKRENDEEQVQLQQQLDTEQQQPVEQQLKNEKQEHNENATQLEHILHRSQEQLESVQQPAEIPVSQAEISDSYLQPSIPKFEATSPPIPTHRKKTVEEMQELLILQQFEQQEVKQQEKQHEVEQTVKQEEQHEVEQPVKQEEQRNNDFELKPLQLNMIDSSMEGNSAPTSPVFPIKSSPEIATHFPRSPRAHVEQLEMPYLEKAIIEPSADHKVNLSGVIAKSPLPLQVTVTQPSPEKPPEEQQLNATIPMGNSSPLNGTFDSAHVEIMDTARPSSRSTFGVPLGEAQILGRRTFSLNGTSEQVEQPLDEQPLNATISINGGSPQNDGYAMPLNAVQDNQRRTFNMSSELQREEPGTGKQQQMRRTFCMEQTPSPAMEATEENIVSADFEPMDVDVSLRAEASVLSTPLSPPIPTHQPKVNTESQSSPPIPTHQSREQQRETHSPPIPTHQQRLSPPLPAQLKRPSIHGDMSTSASALPQSSSLNTPVMLEEQTLSAKEQLSASDEKDDVFVEHFGAMSPISDDVFKAPQHSSSSFSKLAKGKSVEPSNVAPNVDANNKQEQFYDAEFHDGASNNNIILNSSDFDYLYTKGSNNEPIDRSSLLLRFDPLLGTPVPVNQSQQQQQQQELTLLNILSINNNNNQTRALSPTLEEHETSGSNQSFVLEPSAKPAGEGAGIQRDPQYKPPVDRTKKHAKMSVDVIDNDCNKTFDNSNLNSEDKTHKYNNMDELEKKIKNEVTRSEDIEKKLKEAEQREEALVKRITEKDKINTKLNGVIEAYEKAIAELIHDKEQLVQNHERQMQEVQADRDSNYHHLTSLETTFSDLHVKYEKSKEMTSHLKQDEENLLEEKKKLLEKLRQQEQRYEQMKSHAMQQMEIANKKLATMTKEHTDEVKKLKALLKKEEVSRISTAEQLQQKSRENADLLKICEELIYDKGQDF